MEDWGFPPQRYMPRSVSRDSVISWPSLSEHSLRDVQLESASSVQLVKRPVHVPRKVSDELQAKGFAVDGYGVVTWNENSAFHPRRWPVLRKIYDSAIICFLEFFVTLVSNMGSSVAEQAMIDFDISRTAALLSFTTVYLIGQAIGGLIFPPIAESFGGQTIYVVSAFGYSLFCLAIAIWPILPVVVVARFGSGMLSAMPAVVAAGSIENMWDSRARIWVIHLWIAIAVFGLTLGPPVATYVSHSDFGWPWLFYVAAAVTAAVAFLCLAMQESRPSQLLKQQVKVVARKTSFGGLSIESTDSVPNFGTFVRNSLAMPLRLFFTEPIVFLTSFMAATVYGVTYLFSEALSFVYVVGYGFTVEQASLVFMAMAVGIAFTLLPRFYDVWVCNKCIQNKQPIAPEDKLFGFYLAAPILAAGLWWFASSVPPLAVDLSPWVSICSLILIGFSVVEFDNVLSGYLTDTYTSYAASANAPMAFLRASMSGIFPLFGSQMFSRLGANISLFILAAVATAYCGIAVLFGVYGRQIRERSPFAEKTFAIDQQPTIDLVETPQPLEKLCVEKVFRLDGR